VREFLQNRSQESDSSKEKYTILESCFATIQPSKYEP
jgi:hypothetical protein